MSQGKNTEPNKLRNICCQILLGGSSRYIAQRLKCSASSVLNYAARLRYAEVDSLDQLNALSDEQLHDIIYKQGKCLRSCKKESLTIKQLSDNLTQSSSVLPPDYQKFADEYFDRHRKVQFLYTEYLEQCTEQKKGCISRTTFYRHLNQIIKQQCSVKPIMKQEHVYGAELLIDYTGSSCNILQSDGTFKSYSICVLTWAASNYIYAELIPQQTCECTCNAISRALCFFGCRPSVLVCDNAKSMVLKHTTGRDVILNPSFEYFLQRCGIILDANNPFSPSSKSSVELSVRMIQERVLPRFYTSAVKPLSDYNRELLVLINQYINSVGFRKNCSGTSRKELFLKYEKPAAAPLLRDLPLYIEHIPLLKVKPDYRVKINGCSYSVPYNLIGEFVDADISGSIVKIYHKGALVASHPKAGTNKKDVLNPDHMPENHRAVRDKRLKYQNVQDIFDNAQPLSDVLCACCRIFTDRFGMSRKDFCIYLINLYKRKRYERELFDEALNRLMTEPVAKWSSYLFNDILDDIRLYQRNHYGDYERQSVLGFVESGSAFLRGKKAFDNNDKE